MYGYIDITHDYQQINRSSINLLIAILSEYSKL